MIVTSGTLYTDVSFVGTSDISVNSINAGGGNVGIGTNNPATKLDVVDGEVLIGSSSSLHIDIKNIAGAKLILNNRTVRDDSPSTDETKSHGKIIWTGHQRSGASAYIESSADGWDDSGHLSFATSSGSDGAFERMRISKAGNVGIGTTSPSQRLDVNGNATFNGYISFVGGGTDMNRFTTHGVHIGRYTSGSSYFGHIQMVSNNDGGSWIDWVDSTIGDTDYHGRIRYGRSYGFRFYTNRHHIMRISTNGVVGIGTTSGDTNNSNFTVYNTRGSAGDDKTNFFVKPQGMIDIMRGTGMIVLRTGVYTPIWVAHNQGLFLDIKVIPIERGNF